MVGLDVCYLIVLLVSFLLFRLLVLCLRLCLYLVAIRLSFVCLVDYLCLVLLVLGWFVIWFSDLWMNVLLFVYVMLGG